MAQLWQKMRWPQGAGVTLEVTGVDRTKRDLRRFSPEKATPCLTCAARRKCFLPPAAHPLPTSFPSWTSWGCRH